MKQNFKLRCLVVDDEPISRDILEKFIRKTDFLSFEASCTNGLEASEYLRDTEIDIILLDIEMPEMTGMELIKNLRKKPHIILITATPRYAVDAFEYEVSDYLLKPVQYARFLRAVTKILDNNSSQLSSEHNSHSIFIKIDSRFLKIDKVNIDFIEAMGDYVQVFAGSHKYTVYSTLASMIDKINDSNFIRVHRSYIVNVEKITSIEDNTIVVAGKVIPIGSMYRDVLMKKLRII